MTHPTEANTTSETVKPVIHRTATGDVITNGTIEEMFKSTSILGNRRNANYNADVKASRGIRGLRHFAADVSLAKNRIALDVAKARIGERAPAELSRLENEIIMAEIEVRRIEFDKKPFDDPTFVLPSVEFVEGDMPKEMTGADGWKNASGLGAIVADLGPLYKLPATS